MNPNQTATEMITANVNIATKQDKPYSIPCQIFLDATPSMFMQITACHLQLMIIVGKLILKMTIHFGAILLKLIF